MTLLTAIPQYNMHEQKMQTHEEYTLMFISKNLFTLLISSVHSLYLLSLLLFGHVFDGNKDV